MAKVIFWLDDCDYDYDYEHEHEHEHDGWDKAKVIF